MMHVMGLLWVVMLESSLVIMFGTTDGKSKGLLVIFCWMSGFEDKN